MSLEDEEADHLFAVGLSAAVWGALIIACIVIL